MQINKSSPIDLKSLLKLESNNQLYKYHWPVKWDEFLQLEEDIKECFNYFIKSKTGLHSELLLINYKLYLAFYKLLHTIQYITNVKISGKNLSYHEDSNYYKQFLINGYPPYDNIPEPKLTAPDRYKIYKMKIRKNLRYNNFLPNLISKQKVYVLQQSFGDLTLQYLQKYYKGKIRYMDFSELMNESDNLSRHGSDNDLIEFCTEVTKKITEIAESYNLSLSASQINYIQNKLVNSLSKSRILYKQVEKALAKKQPFELFIGGNNNIYSRIISSVLLKNNCRVSGFHHGHPFVLESDVKSWLELSLNSEFYTYTEPAAQALKDTTSRFPVPNGNICEIKGADTGYFHKYDSGDVISKGKKIMLVASNFVRDEQIYISMLPNIPQYYLEKNIIETLNQNGYNLLYKMHPEGYFAGEHIDLYSDVPTITESFENVSDTADAFIYYTFRSTTFGSALCSNKKIIYIKTGLETLNPAMQDLIEKRCYFVESKLNENNLFDVNEEQLCNAVECSDNKLNDSFFSTYMLSNQGTN